MGDPSGVSSSYLAPCKGERYVLVNVTLAKLHGKSPRPTRPEGA